MLANMWLRMTYQVRQAPIIWCNWTGVMPSPEQGQGWSSEMHDRRIQAATGDRVWFICPCQRWEACLGNWDRPMRGVERMMEAPGRDWLELVGCGRLQVDPKRLRMTADRSSWPPCSPGRLMQRMDPRSTLPESCPFSDCPPVPPSPQV